MAILLAQPFPAQAVSARLFATPGNVAFALASGAPSGFDAAMILQDRIPYDTTLRPLPGISPVPGGIWLHIDEAYAEQMAERVRLLRDRRAEVVAMQDSALAPAQEMLDCVLALLPDGFRRQQAKGPPTIICPDGRSVPIDRTDPLGTLGMLIQEDICILQKPDDAHVLTGAVLCFPANWLLAEKLGRPLIGIHDPVPDYDAGIARRVQRLFDGVRAGAPLWRFNLLQYRDPALFQPRSEQAPRAPVDRSTAPYVRSERQTLLRLPESGAVAFAIHTYVVRRGT